MERWRSGPPLKMTLPINKTTLNLKIVSLLLHKGLTHIQSQIQPWLLFCKSFTFIVNENLEEKCSSTTFFHNERRQWPKKKKNPFYVCAYYFTSDCFLKDRHQCKKQKSSLKMHRYQVQTRNLYILQVCWIFVKMFRAMEPNKCQESK